MGAEVSLCSECMVGGGGDYWTDASLCPSYSGIKSHDWVSVMYDP